MFFDKEPILTHVYRLLKWTYENSKDADTGAAWFASVLFPAMICTYTKRLVQAT